MKIKYLKEIRKIYEYRWQDGKLLVRNKRSGDIGEWNTIRGFMEWWALGCYRWREYYQWRDMKCKRVEQKKMNRLWNQQK